MCLLLVSLLAANAQTIKLSTIATNGWASNSVNTVIFRKNSLATYKNMQYAAYYDSARYVVLAQRTSGSITWKVSRTPYQGDATDAHKSISVMVDGAGYLHVAWGQHNNPLNYARSVNPGSLTLTAKLGMTGQKENKLSYPEFYKLADGNLLFFYRDGGSGNGSLIMNYYNYKTQQWTRLQDNLVDGEGQRSAYWQVATDVTGTIHLSWVWRETPDVASNHDMAYACSKDGGKTWQKSTGEKYNLPIRAANAEYACKIPQNSELINQTSMFADAQGQPFIATYYREADQTVPQYHIIYHTGNKWQVSNLGFRKTPFSLSGTGTKRVPVSRPQLIAWKNGASIAAGLIFRDEELGDNVSMAIASNISNSKWEVQTLYNQPVGSWEPTLDTELWKDKGILNLFIQKVTQVDGEGNAKAQLQPIQVLEWKPGSKKK
ncbi:neuraminidase [Mucilaginibacter robiniae]|uniref:Neuraminidase n=2 Tax=Mucilaginibacter robiniae TaxID=2728022 RepID=A0A7L5EBV5_9SPHI|nr:neuraminidase [Mucilaginibacter robiniae]